MRKRVNNPSNNNNNNSNKKIKNRHRHDKCIDLSNQNIDSVDKLKNNQGLRHILRFDAENVVEFNLSNNPIGDKFGEISSYIAEILPKMPNLKLLDLSVSEDKFIKKRTKKFGELKVKLLINVLALKPYKNLFNAIAKHPNVKEIKLENHVLNHEKFQVLMAALEQNTKIVKFGWPLFYYNNYSAVTHSFAKSRGLIVKELIIKIEKQLECNRKPGKNKGASNIGFFDKNNNMDFNDDDNHSNKNNNMDFNDGDNNSNNNMGLK